jgi:hypothetical protein
MAALIVGSRTEPSAATKASVPLTASSRAAGTATSPRVALRRCRWLNAFSPLLAITDRHGHPSQRFGDCRPLPVCTQGNPLAVEGLSLGAAYKDIAYSADDYSRRGRQARAGNGPLPAIRALSHWL